MKNLNSNKHLIVITGPTAIGKTDISIALATYFKTEIISADSRQFYKELKIGTCPPSQVELNKIKHHFIGNLSIKDSYNVYAYEQDVLKKLEELFTKYIIIFMVGGSGLYIDAVCKGIDNLPDPEPKLREELKKQLSNQGIEYLRRQLKLLDPEFYQVVDLSNPNRIMRAIEVCLQTGIPYSIQRKSEKKERNFKITQICLNTDRNILYNRINQRVDKMLSNGLIEEAKSLLPYQHLNSLNTVGYKELFEYFNGNCDLNYAIEKIKTNSRRYAKRQLTWIRKSQENTWFEPNDFVKIVNFIEQKINHPE